MGTIVVTEFISLDGVIESPGPDSGYEHAGWTFDFDTGEEGMGFKFQELMEAEAQLLGRVTYDGFAAAWPSMTDEAGFAEKMNGMPKYVLSSTLDEAEWNNTTVLKGDPAETVAKLKDDVDGVILVAGSGQLTQALIAADLVDEIRLMVFPVVLGSGKRLFGPTGGAKKRFALADTKAFGAGVTLMTYRAG